MSTNCLAMIDLSTLYQTIIEISVFLQIVCMTARHNIGSECSRGLWHIIKLYQYPWSPSIS
jgi:hypothetical protein